MKNIKARFCLTVTEGEAELRMDGDIKTIVNALSEMAKYDRRIPFIMEAAAKIAYFESKIERHKNQPEMADEVKILRHYLETEQRSVQYEYTSAPANLTLTTYSPPKPYPAP